MGTAPQTVAQVTLADGTLSGLAETLRERCRQPGRAAVLIETSGDILAPPDSVTAAPAAAQIGQVLHRAGLPSALAVRGPVHGAGLAALLHFDVVICHPEVTLAAGPPGAVLASGLAWPLRRLLGPVRASALLLAGRTLTAAEAREWGLIAEVDPGCDARAGVLTAGWAARPGARLVRRALAAADRLPVAESQEFDRELLSSQGTPNSSQEGAPHQA